MSQSYVCHHFEYACLLTAIVCSMCTVTEYSCYGLLVCLFLTDAQATTKLDVNPLSQPTIWHRRCFILLEGASAQRCKNSGEYLRAQLSWQKKAVDNTVSWTDPKSHVNMSTSQTLEMETRIKKLHDSTHTLAKKVGHLEAKINTEAEKAGVTVDEGMISAHHSQ